ncbi:hypothetical protein BG011_009542 [Mortierella polycephala]|uniref:N-acetyltransferase domain-containing protein n=1 Tax=Mortierella polycephala TaxID=41804 RepID=A0A9P6PM29_9FUNG|nr:hypothetical protein BG011_009542 [Mortierella polycephala]
MAFTVRFVTTPGDLAQCHEVRYKVFTDEQGYDRELEVDEIDPECLHWLAVDQEGNGVGTARLFKYSSTVGKIGRVAVLQSTRGSGLGRLIIEAIERYTIENTQLDTLGLSSQVPKQGFYSKIGYVPQGDEYLDEGQPHIYMVKNLPSRSQ